MIVRCVRTEYHQSCVLSQPEQTGMRGPTVQRRSDSRSGPETRALRRSRCGGSRVRRPPGPKGPAVHRRDGHVVRDHVDELDARSPGAGLRVRRTGWPPNSAGEPSTPTRTELEVCHHMVLSLCVPPRSPVSAYALQGPGACCFGTFVPWPAQPAGGRLQRVTAAAARAVTLRDQLLRAASRSTSSSRSLGCMYLQVMNPVRRGGVCDLLEALGSIQPSENDRQDDFGRRLLQVLARHPDVGETSLAPESSLALGDAYLERPEAFDDGAHLRERLQRIRVTCEEVLRSWAPTRCHKRIVTRIEHVRLERDCRRHRRSSPGAHRDRG